MSPHLRLATRFLTLPFFQQFRIAQDLGLLTQQDLEMRDEDMWLLMFVRAKERDLVEQVESKTEEMHQRREAAQ